MAKFPKYARLTSGTYDNPEQTVEDITVIENNLEGGGDVSVTSDDITDASTVGKSVLTASDAAAARTAVGAGTSSLALGTSGTTAKAGDYVPAWTDVTGKPATFAPVIGATATTAVAGNDSRLTAQAVATASVRALAGGTATTASASDHTHTGLTADAVAATASIRTLGTGAQQAAVGSHTHTATQVTATAISPGTATTVQGILAELAARIAELETP